MLTLTSITYIDDIVLLSNIMCIYYIDKFLCSYKTNSTFKHVLKIKEHTSLNYTVSKFNNFYFFLPGYGH
jgi:hypothetical protein